MNNKLSTNLIANLFSYVIALFISFYLTPFLVKNLGKALYGFYSIANSFVSYITVISVALNSMAAKYITLEIVRGNNNRAKQYYTSIFFANIILSIVLIPFLVVLVLNLRSILSISDYYLLNVQVLFALIFSAMLLRFVTSIFGCATFASNRMDLRAYTEMTKSVIRFGLYLLLFYFLKPSIVYLGIVMFLLELFNSIVQIMLAKKLTPNLRICRSYNNVIIIFSTLKIGVWNSVNQIGDLLLSSSELVMSNILLGEFASGNISIIKTMPSMISGMITATNSVFMPRVALLYAKGEIENLVKEVQKSQRIMGALVSPICILLIIFGFDFYKLWVPGNDTRLLMYLSAFDVARMLIIGVTWPVSNLNIVLDKVKTPSLLVVFCGMFNVLSMIILVKLTNLGIYSIVITTLILTIIFYGLFIPMYPCKVLEIPLLTFMKPIAQMIVVAIISSVIIVPIHAIIEIQSWIDFFVYGGFCAIIVFVLSFIVFIGPRQIRITLEKFKIIF